MKQESPLRKCRLCGLEAYTEDTLALFERDRAGSSKYGRRNICKRCAKDAAIARKKYPEFVNFNTFYNKFSSPLRMCVDCGFSIWKESELKLFVKAKEDGAFGRFNLCHKCHAKRNRIGGKYYSKVRQVRNDLKRINFRGKTVRLKHNPRINICPVCNRKYPENLERQTCVHHDGYDFNDLLAYTRELCNSCHARFHGKIRGNP